MSVPGRKSPSTFRHWCQKELSKLLHFDVERDQVEYLMSIESERDTREYLQGLLGVETKQAQVFVNEFFRHWHPPQQHPITTSSSSSSDPKTITAAMHELSRPSADKMVLFSKDLDEVGV